MANTAVRDAIQKLSRLFAEQPERASSQDPPATAILEEGLRTQVTGRRGERVATDMVPALGGAVFEGVRVGLRPSTPDELPAIGASTTMRSVFYATGHYRNGVLLAPLTALLVADLVLEGRERAELSLTRPGRLGL